MNFSEYVKGNTLSIEKTSIDSIQQLINFLKNNIHITALNLTGYSINYEHIEILVKSGCLENLTQLNLKDNEVSAQGAETLAESQFATKVISIGDDTINFFYKSLVKGWSESKTPGKLEKERVKEIICGIARDYNQYRYIECGRGLQSYNRNPARGDIIYYMLDRPCKYPFKINSRDEQRYALSHLFTFDHNIQKVLFEHSNMIPEYKLFYAAKKGDLESVKKAVESGADVSIQDENGNTPLHWAAKNGYIDMVRYLITKGLNVNAKDNQGKTPLYYTAIESRAYEMQEQHPGVMAKVLLENGADPNIKLKDGSYDIMSTITSTHSNALPTTIYMIACYASNLDEELKQQIEVNENLRDDFKKGERIRNYIDRILLDVQSEIERGGLKIGLNFGYDYHLRKFIEKSIGYRELEKLLEDEKIHPCYYALGVCIILGYIEEHVLINGKRYTKKHVFLHNNKIIIDILSEVYGRRLQGMSGYELDEFIRESDKKFKDICDIGLINTLFDFDISKLNVIVPTLHQLAYVEVLRLLENNRHEELRYSFGKFIKTQEAHIREQNSEEAFNDIRYLYEEADEKVDTKLKAPIRDPVIPSEGAKKLEQSPQAYPKKPKSNSKYYYIGVFTIAGLAIGLIAAYIAGAPEVVFIVAAVAGMLIGAAFGVGIDYGISKCFANPNVEAHKQPGLVSHQ